MPDLATKEGWCAAWGLSGEEADRAWAAKQAFVPQRLTPLIIGDIQPYRAMGTDVATGTAPMITSRSEHREFLRRNNYVELGNDSSLQAPPKERAAISDREIKQQVKQAIDQKGIRL